MKKKYIMKTILVTFVITLSLAVIGFSYAYFSTEITGEGKYVTLDTANLKLKYTDNTVLSLDNAIPGDFATKTFTVENIGTEKVSYNIVWNNLINTINNYDLQIDMKCKSYKNYNTTNQIEEGKCDSFYKAVPYTETSISKDIKRNSEIDIGITHEYTVTITFKNRPYLQNDNLNKSFSGKIDLEEYVDNSVYCTFDGTLTQGAEYVNGQYTYRYLKEYTRNPRPTGLDDLRVDHNIENGWSVVLANVTSTEPVTSKVCTYINNMPVTSMSMMYTNSKATSIDLSSINTGNVTNMGSMFERTTAKTLDVSNFDTSKVTDMSGMFWRSEATIIDLNGFNTSNVTDMSNMFQTNKSTILDVSKFDTSKVTNMSGMFFNSPTTTLDLNSFKTSNVTNMRLMFCNSEALIIKGLNNFATSNVTNMNRMFEGSHVEEIDVSSFDTKNVTDMSWMFSNSSSLKRIYASDKFNTSKVTSSNYMFNDSPNLVGGNSTKYNSSFVDKTYARIDGGTSNPGYFTSK